MVSDEKIIASLMHTKTMGEAAELAGVSRQTIYNKMNDNDFLLLYKGVKADFLRVCVNELNDKICDAIRVTAEIMNDEDVNPAVRLQAATCILNNAGKFATRLITQEDSLQFQVYKNEHLK